MQVAPAQKVGSRVAWGAVFAGLFVATTIFLLTGALATAVSLSTHTQALYESPLWIAVLTMAAMFAGGLTAAYLSAGERTGEAMLHGVVLWGATALMLLFFLLNGINLYGSEMMVGQADTLFDGLSAADAWWAFAGVLGSLCSTVLGATVGRYRQSAVRVRAMVRLSGAL